MVFLETSSYLPLIWTTPYSQSVVDLMRARANTHEFVLQRDCVAEAAGYLAFEDNWRYHPAVRIRRLVERASEAELARLGFPSTAVQLLLGGNIWPQAQYLNYIRHTAFFLADLLDEVSWESPRDGLNLLAGKVEDRIRTFRGMFERHLAARTVELPNDDLLPYWGGWYLRGSPPRFSIRLVDDPRPYNMTADKLRDIYHYECAMHHVPKPDAMIVANTGFSRNVKASVARRDLQIVCAETLSAEFFSGGGAQP